jgi:hypothetical protein
MVDSTGTTTYEYDALNRLESVTFPGSRGNVGECLPWAMPPYTLQNFTASTIDSETE